MHIAPIKAVRGAFGGKYVEDSFSIKSTPLVELLISEFNVGGHGALVIRPNNTAVLMGPPFDISFKTVRGPTKMPTVLAATAHFICLVDRPGNPKGPRWAFDESRADYGLDANKLSYKVAVAAALAELGDGVVPARMRKWIEPLLRVIG